ncbi:transposase [Psychrosphaera saromensis]|uniref:Transposase n=1 Tax=Psychrosphaera saromensis TaxID=716813 RepID=A0A2S7URS5_9GAMM|nr:transposase [Psychrosphaera saromensis]PQJ52694.1 transposase [Psychrosphaera saromensis]GHB70513.1 transposase [Psychrosphaera saromensis]GLQ13178.1 transposase [Psychrosphaera saromensis]
MPQPRKSQISLIDTPYYHCISRCVRRAFLCGVDEKTGMSYEHRRQWVEDRLLFLTQVFAIDVCAFSVMSNHTHIVLFVDEETNNAWTTDEVLTRWHKLFKGTLLTQKYLSFINAQSSNPPTSIKSTDFNESELLTIERTAQVYRQRLMNISWFMRVLNEGIAREANKEDECTGHFWEGRFKSQALLDEAALLSCMAYVDLNPVRAKAASTPETSDFTSIKQRIQYALNKKQPNRLMPFVGDTGKEPLKGVPFELKDYLELVDITGKCIREDKAGHISENLPNILSRLNINEDNWLIITKQFTKVFHGAVGHEHVLQNFSDNQQRKRRPNVSSCKRLLA